MPLAPLTIVLHQGQVGSVGRVDRRPQLTRRQDQVGTMKPATDRLMQNPGSRSTVYPRLGSVFKSWWRAVACREPAVDRCGW